MKFGEVDRNEGQVRRIEGNSCMGNDRRGSRGNDRKRGREETGGSRVVRVVREECGSIERGAR